MLRARVAAIKLECSKRTGWIRSLGLRGLNDQDSTCKLPTCDISNCQIPACLLLCCSNLVAHCSSDKVLAQARQIWEAYQALLGWDQAWWQSLATQLWKIWGRAGFGNLWERWLHANKSVSLALQVAYGLNPFFSYFMFFAGPIFLVWNSGREGAKPWKRTRRWTKTSSKSWKTSRTRISCPKTWLFRRTTQALWGVGKGKMEALAFDGSYWSHN